MNNSWLDSILNTGASLFGKTQDVKIAKQNAAAAAAAAAGNKPIDWKPFAYVGGAVVVLVVAVFAFKK